MTEQILLWVAVAPFFGLAAYRLSSLLVDEAGPFDIFIAVRSIFGIKHDAEGTAEFWPNNYFAQMLSCVFCTSLNVSFVLWFLWVFAPSVSVGVAFPFAVGGVAAWLHGRTE